MVMRNRRECDVFGTTRKVESYVVKVFVKSEGSQLITVVSEDESDLSPRGLLRLKKFIRRGMTAPSASGIGEASNDDKQGDEEGGAGC